MKERSVYSDCDHSTVCAYPVLNNGSLFQNVCYIDKVLILDPIIQPRSFGGHCIPQEYVVTVTVLIITSCRAQAMM